MTVAAERLTNVDRQSCLKVLRLLADSPESVPDREEIERLVARVYRRTRKVRRKQSERARFAHDRQIVAQTGRARASTGTPSNQEGHPPERTAKYRLLRARSRLCYICKARYREVHHFYHSLCPECANLNFEKRFQQADLQGRMAFVTGGRIKIGLQVALKLLRAGAGVTITTRFPRDAARRYSCEPDFPEWQDRLTILQSDFRDIPGVLRLVEELRSALPALDILVNNAAQSVRRSREYYARLAEIEGMASLPTNLAGLPDVLPLRMLRPADSKNGDHWPLARTFHLDSHGEVIDTREQNSWTQRLDEVEPVELLEVLLVNATAPCLLTSGLKPLFLQSRFPDRYIVNVTGLDGQFGRRKSFRHPHVNMSKAALNMLTRTSAADYSLDRIFMNSVDTGWITHEGAYSRRESMRNRGFVPPLDETDGAARILDPVFRGVQGERSFGQLFRNFSPAQW